MALRRRVGFEVSKVRADSSQCSLPATKVVSSQLLLQCHACSSSAVLLTMIMITEFCHSTRKVAKTMASPPRGTVSSVTQNESFLPRGACVSYFIIKVTRAGVPTGFSPSCRSEDISQEVEDCSCSLRSYEHTQSPVTPHTAALRLSNSKGEVTECSKLCLRASTQRKSFPKEVDVARFRITSCFYLCAESLLISLEEVQHNFIQLYIYLLQ